MHRSLHKIALLFLLLLLFPHPVAAANYYIAPNQNHDGTPNNQGSDNNPGTLTQPFKTFTKSWSAMTPGDTLYLLDGIFLQTYTPTIGGTSTAAITTKALNDGQAIIDGEYIRPAIQIGTWNGDNNGHYHVIEGIIARNSSQTTIALLGNNNILRRVSAYNANTNGNHHNISSATGAHGNVVEDCIASGSGRKMVFAYSGNNFTIRRCFAYWQQWDARTFDGSHYPWGNAFEMYNTSDGIIENAIAVGAYPDVGLSILSNMSTTQSPNPANNNKLLGSVIVNNGVFPDGSLWRWPMTKPSPTDGYNLRLYWDWADNRIGVKVWTWGLNAVIQNTLIQDVVSYGGMSLGLSSSAEDPNSFPVGTTVNRVTVLNNRQDPWVSTNLDGPIGTDIITERVSRFTITNSRIGKACSEANKTNCVTNPHSGEGARLAHRYINGVLKDGTDGSPAQPLWPWPMQDRLIKETGIDVTGHITDILYTQNTSTGSPHPAPFMSPEPPWGNPLKAIQGITYLSPVTVTFTSRSGGTVYYTLDGSDPQTSPTKITYHTPFTISQTTLIKAREQINNSWSHLRSAYFLINQNLGNQAPTLTADIEPHIYPTAQIVWPNNQVSLYGTIEDYTYPASNTRLTTQWTKVSGEGTVTFGNAALPRTSATFSQPGIYTLRLNGSDGQLSTTKEVQVRVWPNDMQGVVHTIPGRIEAENYKSGGEGIGYHQTRWYGDVLYRNQPVSKVDITYAYNDLTGFAVQHINPEEWFAYDVKVEYPGIYQGTLRYSASPGGNTLRILLNNQDISGTLTTQSTLNSKKYGSLSFTTPPLPSGNHELRISIDPFPTPTPAPPTNPTSGPSPTPSPTPRPPFLPGTTLNYLEFTLAEPPPTYSLDEDTDVDILDLLILLSRFTQNLVGDFNQNGRIDIFDFNMLLRQS